MRATASGRLVHLCPYKDEVDVGDVAVSWDPEAHDIELHALAASFRTFFDYKATHEEVVKRLAYEHGPCTVVGRFITAGLDVVVEASTE